MKRTHSPKTYIGLAPDVSHLCPPLLPTYTGRRYQQAPSLPRDRHRRCLPPRDQQKPVITRIAA
ncbi:MAG: hypothetical protein ACI4X9_07905, partial [Kiritimatiellia bacterium]